MRVEAGALRRRSTSRMTRSPASRSRTVMSMSHPPAIHPGAAAVHFTEPQALQLLLQLILVVAAAVHVLAQLTEDHQERILLLFGFCHLAPPAAERPPHRLGRLRDVVLAVASRRPGPVQARVRRLASHAVA